MTTLPDSCGTAFKEWSEICRALLEGRQTLILRKGGILEGPNGFAPEHDAFWLYPTFVHQAENDLDRAGAGHGSTGPSGPSPTDRVTIEGLATVSWMSRLEDEELLSRLEPFHVWSSETITKRFHYRRPGLWVLAVRVFRLDRPWSLVPSVDQLGCKSWVSLDEPVGTVGLSPVLEEGAWSQALHRLEAVIQSQRGPA